MKKHIINIVCFILSVSIFLQILSLPSYADAGPWGSMIIVRYFWEGVFNLSFGILNFLASPFKNNNIDPPNKTGNINGLENNKEKQDEQKKIKISNNDKQTNILSSEAYKQFKDLNTVI
ncbi:hypothetical protein ACFL52_04590 [Candidatus Margulisiibacteriota bacterium]